MRTKLLSILSFMLLGYNLSLAQPGMLDTLFDPLTGPNERVITTSIQSDGKILICGFFWYYAGKLRNHIARLNTDGSLDTTFNLGTGANDIVGTISIQSDGKIIIGGSFTSYNGTAINRIARLNTDGSLDTSFHIGTGPNGYVSSTSIQNDGKIIITGGFTAYNGTARPNIARLNTDGSLDTSFIPGTGGVNNSTSLTSSIQNDGKIIITGDFTSYGGKSSRRIARLNTDGSRDTSFNPGTGANNLISTNSIQSDGKIIIGGFFTSYNGTAINRIARLNTDGSLDITFNPGIGASSGITATSIQSDGRIIIGGFFTSYNVTAINRIARLNPNGSLDFSFNPGTGANEKVNDISIQSDGKIIIAGQFTVYNGIARSRIARLFPGCETIGTDIIVACNSFSWIDGNTYTANNNTATHTLTNGAGCDSLVTLNLTLSTVDTSVAVSTNMLTANAISGTYQWVDCNNSFAEISGETNQIFTPGVSGNYAVIVTQNNCTDTSSCHNITLTGFNELSDNMSSVIYPNPFSGQTTFRTDSYLKGAMLTVYNSWGQTVKQISNISGHTITLYQDNLTAGLYYIRLTEGNQIIMIEKLVITD